MSALYAPRLLRGPYLLLLAPIVASCVRFDPPPVNRIIADQAQRYPRMQVQDWYKLFYQSALGNEHLLADSSAVYHYLLHEWENLGPSAGEPLVEYLSADSQVVRLNLRPYRASGGSPADVYRMMAASTSFFTPSVDAFEATLAHLVFLAERGDVWVNPDALAAFIEEQRGRDYPAVHHSELYEQAYRPAYRVLARATLASAGIR